METKRGDSPICRQKGETPRVVNCIGGASPSAQPDFRYLCYDCVAMWGNGQGGGANVNEQTIYGENLAQMEQLRSDVAALLDELRRTMSEGMEFDPIEHCLSRIKAEDSMREKCRRQGLPETTYSALVKIQDSIGFRVVCAFRSDVYLVRDYLAGLEGFEVITEKDYIKNAKENGYRSYHMILRTTDGRVPVGCDPVRPDDEPARGFFIEVQLRTISMDTWAALEHHMKYKKKAPANERLIVAELKRCADELASTDVSMQALRDLILEEQ